MKKLIIFLAFDQQIRRGSLKKLKPLLFLEKRKDLSKNRRELSILVEEGSSIFTLNPVELYKNLQSEFGKNLKIKLAFLEHEMIFWQYYEEYVCQIEPPVQKKITDTIKFKRAKIKIKIIDLRDKS